jgi:hypothetical protein
MPAPPVREAPQVEPAPLEPLREQEAWRDFDHPAVIHQPRTMSVCSGELLVGLLREQGQKRIPGLARAMSGRPRKADMAARSWRRGLGVEVEEGVVTRG